MTVLDLDQFCRVELIFMRFAQRQQFLLLLHTGCGQTASNILVTLQTLIFFSYPYSYDSIFSTVIGPLFPQRRRWPIIQQELLMYEWLANHNAGAGMSRNVCGINSARLVASNRLHTQLHAHMWNYCSFVTTVFMTQRRITYLSRHLQLHYQRVPIQIPPPDVTVHYCRQPSRSVSNISRRMRKWCFTHVNYLIIIDDYNKKKNTVIS